MASYSQAERGATGVNNHQLVPLPPLAVPIPRPPSTGVQRHHQCQAGAGIFGSSSILLAYCSPKQTKRHPPQRRSQEGFLNPVPALPGHSLVEDGPLESSWPTPAQAGPPRAGCPGGFSVSPRPETPPAPWGPVLLLSVGFAVGAMAVLRV